MRSGQESVDQPVTRDESSSLTTLKTLRYVVAKSKNGHEKDGNYITVELMDCSIKPLFGSALRSDEPAMITATIGIFMCGEYIGDTREQRAFAGFLNDLGRVHAWLTQSVMSAFWGHPGNEPQMVRMDFSQ